MTSPVEAEFASGQKEKTATDGIQTRNLQRCFRDWLARQDTFFYIDSVKLTASAIISRPKTT